MQTTPKIYNNFKKKEVNLSQYAFGKVQPQALPLEETILGAIMLDKDALSIVLDILKTDSFYSEPHQLIFAACLRLYNKSHTIDLLTVAEELKSSGDLQKIGGPAYLAGLTNRIASAANIEFHARIVAQKHVARQIIKNSVENIRTAYEEKQDVFELLDQVGKQYSDIIADYSSRNSENVNNLIGKYFKEVERASQQKDGLTGIPSGFTDIDRMTAGWQPSDLIIIAARPGMGKTAITLAFAKNAAEFGKNIAIFSLEMSKMQLIGRLAALESEINSQKLKKGQLEEYEWAKLHTALEKISALNIQIDDTPGLSINELRAKCRRMMLLKERVGEEGGGIHLVIVDYLQLMSGTNKKGGNREQEISEISRGLKLLAKELNVPVIAISQLSRAVETRGGMKRPQLSDLRESGAIENDSDMIGFIYRPEYYQITEDEEGNSLKGVAELIIAKHRNGPLGTVKLKFTDKYAKFTDAEDLSFDVLPNATSENTITPFDEGFKADIREKKINNTLLFRPTEGDLKNLF